MKSLPWIIVCLLTVFVVYQYVDRQGKPGQPSATISTDANQGSLSSAKATDDFNADAEAAVECVEALRSATEAGVLYAEYVRRVADAQVGVDKFLNKHGADGTMAGDLSTAMGHFRAAGDLWSEYVRVGRNMLLSEQNQTAARILNTYPELQSTLLVIPRVLDAPEERMINVRAALRMLWAKGGQCASDARAELQTAE